MNEPALIREVLDNSSLWFIVGLGNNPSRAAFGVSRTIAAHGKRVVPIHPRAESVHGEPGFTSIAEAAAVHGPPDVVDMFVRSDRVGVLTDQALTVGARAVWFQLGVIDFDAAKRVEDAGVTMIMDRCPAIEWSRV